ncbi:MAG TPA: hypothetical protein VF629_10075 [Hymenobacter sp.]|jgi:hypothetical protein|uniref:hypothetical protein n=1 Tax=Hymenobacter sp. TaxID=1898978 RepID=UPI002ED817A3
MNAVANIEKISEVTVAQMEVEPSKKDTFLAGLVQTGALPFIFYYGKRRVLQHTCNSCGIEVSAEFAFGKQLIGLGTLSKEDFNNNTAQLDIMGRLFEQHLRHYTDENGMESYLYLSAPDPNKGALLSVSYYRCAHCHAQYLVLYQKQLKDERPPFEPDEIRIEKIFQVSFDEDKLLGLLNRAGLSVSA